MYIFIKLFTPSFSIVNSWLLVKLDFQRVRHLQVYCMLCYHRSQVPRQPGWSVGYWFTNITLTTFCCLAEHHLLVAKRAVDCHGLASAHTPHHSTPGGERALFPFPHSLVLSACLSSQIIHSRAKSQSLSPSFSVCLYGSVNLPAPPLYYSPLLSSPFPFSLSWEGKKMNDTCDVLCKSGEQSDTEQSVSPSVCMSHAAALERLKYR